MTAKAQTSESKTPTAVEDFEIIELSPACSDFLFSGASCDAVLQLLTANSQQRFLQMVKDFHGGNVSDEELKQVDDDGNAHELLTDERADDIIEALLYEDREAHDAIIAELEEAFATPDKPKDDTKEK